MANGVPPGYTWCEDVPRRQSSGSILGVDLCKLALRTGSAAPSAERRPANQAPYSASEEATSKLLCTCAK